MPKRKSYVISSIPELDHHAAEILEFGRRSLADIIEIGRRLVRCRELLKPQGCWLAWIKTKFGWSRAHADNLIAVFEARDRLLKFSSLPISALYLLAKRDPEFLLSIEHHVEAGEPVNARTLRVHDDQGSRRFLYNLRPGNGPSRRCTRATIVRPTTTPLRPTRRLLARLAIATARPSFSAHVLPTPALPLMVLSSD